MKKFSEKTIKMIDGVPYTMCETLNKLVPAIIYIDGMPAHPEHDQVKYRSEIKSEIIAQDAIEYEVE